MAGIFAAMGTLFLVLGTHTFYRNCQFAGPVERTIGVVTGRNITISHGRHGSSTTYHLAYRFFDVVGTGYVCSTTVTSQTYYNLNEGGQVPVKYLPHYAAINRVDRPVEDRSHETTAWVFMGIGGLFGGFGWYSFIRLEKLIFYRRWLRKNGVRCAGTVDGVEVDTSLSVNHRNVRYLTYSYTDSTGRKHQDSSQGLSIKQEELWETGDSIDVYYDPRNYSASAVGLDR